MLIISSVLGLWLVLLTDIVVLLLGGLCFLCGIFYTFGPVPISRQPLGEIFSGIFYGLLVPFILLYINMPEGYFLSFNFSDGALNISLALLPIITVLLLSVAPVCCTANIMLANNICDLEHDIVVRRHTLPYLIGKKSLKLFAILYYATYAATILMAIFKMLSPICLLSLLTIIPVQKNINQFFKVQQKETTFVLSIKNFVIIMGVNTLLIFISGLF